MNKIKHIQIKVFPNVVNSKDVEIYLEVKTDKNYTCSRTLPLNYFESIFDDIINQMKLEIKKMIKEEKEELKNEKML